MPSRSGLGADSMKTVSRRVTYLISSFVLITAWLARCSPVSTIAREKREWTSAVLPGMFVEYGTYGVEVSPSFHWIGERSLIFRLVNPTSDDVRVFSTIRVGRAVCGSRPRLLSKTDTDDLRVHAQGDAYILQASIEKRQSKQIKFRVEGKSCKVQDDPRVFYGSILGFETDFERE
jgi:hypothetical protein